MSNFWQHLEKPFFALAPMEDVTDTVFREVILSVSSPEVLKVIFTEFTSTEGLTSSKGFSKVSSRLKVNETEKVLLRSMGVKLVAQIWGNKPEKYYQSVKLLHEMNRFDGVDINMGCPVKKIVKKGCCSALIDQPQLAKELILAAKEASPLPVSVKTRTGYKLVQTENWISQLLETNPAAITLHGRTQKMQSDGEADWNQIALAVKLRNASGRQTLILGNGDVSSWADGLDRIRNSGADGAMVGTGVFRNPWLFNKQVHEIPPDEKIELLNKHLALFEASWKNQKSFQILKRFFKIYLNGFRGASAMRADLMRCNTYEEAKQSLLTMQEDRIIVQ